MLKDTKLPFDFACMLLLVMTKNLTLQNFTQWVKRRILTFSGTVGDVYTPANVTESQFPLLSCLQELYANTSTNHPIRKTIFQ